MMGRLGFAAPQIWAVLIDRRGQLLPGVVKVEGCPPEPDAGTVVRLVESLLMVLELETAGGSFALLWARPGGGALGDTDRAWARAFTAAAHDASAPMWPVHLANDSVLRIASPDDLVA